MKPHPRGRTLFALAALTLLAACSKAALPPEPPRPVLTQIIGKSGESASENYTGEVRSRYETPLSFRVGGKITARLVDTGAIVKAGDVLARLDPADTVLSAQAAQAQLILAEAEVRRFRELRSKNFVSQAALDSKESTLQAARAQADLARNQSTYTTLRAEQAGVVGLMSAEVGQVVTAGQTVMRVARADTLEVAIAIPESRMQGLRTGQAAEVSLWQPEQARYPATLREISPVADPVTRTFAARVAIARPDEKLLLGMTANVRFNNDGNSDKFTVPLTAIFQQDGKPALWLVNEDLSVQLRPVDIAAYLDNSAVLAGGVRPGDRFVVAGVHKLAAGEKIRLANTTLAAGGAGK